MGKTHELKVHLGFFDDLLNGKKSFEYRKNDRDYKVGDLLFLKEWNQETETYTGRERYFGISYVLQGGQYGIPEGYCIMSVF